MKNNGIFYHIMELVKIIELYQRNQKIIISIVFNSSSWDQVDDYEVFSISFENQL